MKKSEYKLQCQGEERFFSYWPVAAPKAVVLLVHGMGEHIGRYDWVAAQLNEAGYSAIGMDLTGHGQSSGARGHSPSYERFYMDLDSLVTEANKHCEGLTQILFGHSMGGSVTTGYLLHRDYHPAALVLSSPGLAPAIKPNPILIALGKLLYHLWPSIGLSNNLVLEGLSKDKKNIEAYLADPLNHDRLSPRLGLDFLATGQETIKTANQIKTPCYLFHGTKDQLASFDAAETFSVNMGEHCHFEIIEGGFHETLNDFGKEEVMSKVISWLQSSLQSS